MNTAFDRIDWQYVSENGQSWIESFDGTSAQLERIKDDDQRSVYRHRTGMYVKKIRYSGMRSLYKTFAGGNAANEGTIALTMKQRGISVPEVMAYGRIKSRGLLHEDVLMAREIADCKSLHDFIEYDFPLLNFEQKKNVIEAFSEFIRKLHDRGVYHRDLHLKNVVIQHHGEKARFTILDLNSVSLSSNSIPWRRRSDQLGILMAICWEKCSRSDRFRFFQHYAPDRKKQGKKILIKNISIAARRHINRLLSSRARQSVSTNSRFVNEKVQGYQVFRKREFDPESFFSGFNESKIKLCNDSFTGRDSGNLISNDNKYFIRKFSTPPGAGSIAALLDGSVGKRIWKNIWRFPFNKILVPAPLMMISRRDNETGESSYLITGYIADAISLPAYWARANPVDKKALCVKICKLVGTMHRFGAVHGDLSWEKFMVLPSVTGDKIYLCDAHKVKNYKILNRKKSEIDVEVLVKAMERNGVEQNYRSLFKSCWLKWAGF
jgi:tRNA A-37 threonylcarbamoyl transferase component Bud32